LNSFFFEKYLGCESRAYVLFIHEKNRVQKSHATGPLIGKISTLFLS